MECEIIVKNPYASQHRKSLELSPPQATEGWALIEMARRLENARKTPDDTDNILIQSRLNWRIWTIFQAELVDPECETPKEIRENLLSLSNFIDKRSADIIGKPEASKLEVLININRQVGAGLMENKSAEDQDQGQDDQSQGDQSQGDSENYDLDG